MKRENPKMVSNVIKQIVDTETGEITDTTVEKHFVTRVKTDEFFMVFIENLAPFYGLKQAGDIRLMVAMCEMAEFNTGIIRMSKKIRQMLCDKANISYSNISRHLSRLSASKLIIEDDGDYTINPTIFWKGSTTTRTEVLQNEGLTFQITLYEETKKDAI